MKKVLTRLFYNGIIITLAHKGEAKEQWKLNKIAKVKGIKSATKPLIEKLTSTNFNFSQILSLS